MTVTPIERLPALTHDAWLEIDLSALVNNAGVLRRAIPQSARLGLLVKANGYGHGLEMAARAAVVGGADLLIVAALDEGLALRAAGIGASVMVVYPTPPDAVAEAVLADLELSVSGVASTRRLFDAWARRRKSATGRVLSLHVEVDTGMGRGGVAPASLPELVGLIDRQPGARIVGMWSHLADGSDPDVSGEQVHRFDNALAELATVRGSVPPRHLVATEGIFAATAPAYDMVRVGLGFYGELGVDFQPAAGSASLAAELRPAMTVKALPVHLESMPTGASVGYGGEWTAARPSVIATLPIGYSDGWTRAYWPGATALVRGRRVPLVGRVSMDSVCADVTDVDGVTLTDEVVLLGRQGNERITPNELARLRRSIPNEVFCAFGPRLPRVYLADERTVAISRQADRVERLAGSGW
jgi:alanine racemase